MNQHLMFVIKFSRCLLLLVPVSFILRITNKFNLNISISYIIILQIRYALQKGDKCIIETKRNIIFSSLFSGLETVL